MTPCGVRVTARLTAVRVAWLDAFARAQGMSRSQAIQHVLDAFAARYEAVIDEPTQDNEKRS